MRFSNAYHWLTQGTRRQAVLIKLTQPMTAGQLHERVGISEKSCSEALAELLSHGLVNCLNPEARRSRLYWISDLGSRCRRRLVRSGHSLPAELHLPQVDWELYGWVCYSHRSTVIRTLTVPMQPSAIKRRARFNNPNLRMSAANVRDVIRLFLRRGIVKTVQIKGERHPRYDLTETGKHLRSLLHNAERS